jgi:hypothetical protein
MTESVFTFILPPLSPLTASHTTLTYSHLSPIMMKMTIAMIITTTTTMMMMMMMMVVVVVIIPITNDNDTDDDGYQV